MLIFLENTLTANCFTKSLYSRGCSALLARRLKRGHLHHLHADDPGSGLLNAGLRAAGVTHFVDFGGFAAQEFSGRIRDSNAKVVFTASCGIEPYRLVNYKIILIKLGNSELGNQVDGSAGC